MVETDDWRLLNARRHLEGAAFRRKPYRAKSWNWDHDQCAACWDKFAESRAPDALHEGYAVTGDHKLGEDSEWVCVECFDLLKEELHWRVVE